MAPLVTSERRKEEGRRAAAMAAAAVSLALACVLCLTLLASGELKVQQENHAAIARNSRLSRLPGSVGEDGRRFSVERILKP
eukprot:767633-Hanusia_phi.AAC.9